MRGHKYKLYKKQSSINACKYFFSNRICDIWNALPNFVFDVSSSNNFRRLLDKVDLSQFAVLTVIVHCYYFVGHMLVTTCPLCPVSMFMFYVHIQ